MSMVNAHILYNKYSNKKLSLYDFREQVIESLLPEKKLLKRVRQPREDNQHKLTKIEKTTERTFSSGKKVTATARKDCRNCYKNKKRVNTTMECKSCPNSPPMCLECFFVLHYCTLNED